MRCFQRLDRNTLQFLPIPLAGTCFVISIYRDMMNYGRFAAVCQQMPDHAMFCINKTSKAGFGLVLLLRQGKAM